MLTRLITILKRMVIVKCIKMDLGSTANIIKDTVIAPYGDRWELNL